MFLSLKTWPKPSLIARVERIHQLQNDGLLGRSSDELRNRAACARIKTRLFFGATGLLTIAIFGESLPALCNILLDHTQRMRRSGEDLQDLAEE
ncbi:hypothetical protein A6X21_19380 [Planctopirus hydrillae]|uniref:Uncharacterized protein n=1 Tax=Planctopirus hydrillae TaxID=1841610 RepID=A0A1C3EH53_9PLAN|nr:hypothetical protein A6X21_19380 [Planctopirus hydrillae]